MAKIMNHFKSPFIQPDNVDLSAGDTVCILRNPFQKTKNLFGLEATVLELSDLKPNAYIVEIPSGAAIHLPKRYLKLIRKAPTTLEATYKKCLENLRSFYGKSVYEIIGERITKSGMKKPDFQKLIIDLHKEIVGKTFTPEHDEKN